jgi:hypothetical protein
LNRRFFGNQVVIGQLTGGLGNQLFQMTAALNNNKKSVLLASSIGLPRTTNGKPDLMLLSLPERISFDLKRPKGFILGRLTNYLLRLGLKDDKTFAERLTQRFLRPVYELLASIHFRRRVRVFVSSNVGFVEVPHEDVNLLVGYFQSWKFLVDESVSDELMAIYPSNPSPKFQSLESEISRISPIVVHVRLGDYLNEGHFGVPSEDYYLEAIARINLKRSRDIWLFSNDESSLRSCFPNLVRASSAVVGDDGLNSVETMELMRHGSALVIANSTFSWWSATLRYDKSAAVFAPSPWFRGMPEPRDLLPIDWIRLDVNSYL